MDTGRWSSKLVTLLSQSAHFGVESCSNGSWPTMASSSCRSNWFNMYRMCQLEKRQSLSRGNWVHYPVPVRAIGGNKLTVIFRLSKPEQKKTAHYSDEHHPYDTSSTTSINAYLSSNLKSTPCRGNSASNSTNIGAWPFVSLNCQLQLPWGK